MSTFRELCYPCLGETHEHIVRIMSSNPFARCACGAMAPIVVEFAKTAGEALQAVDAADQAASYYARSNAPPIDLANIVRQIDARARQISGEEKYTAAEVRKGFGDLPPSALVEVTSGVARCSTSDTKREALERLEDLGCFTRAVDDLLRERRRMAREYPPEVSRGMRLVAAQEELEAFLEPSTVAADRAHLVRAAALIVSALDEGDRDHVCKRCRHATPRRLLVDGEACPYCRLVA